MVPPPGNLLGLLFQANGNQEMAAIIEEQNQQGVHHSQQPPLEQQSNVPPLEQQPNRLIGVSHLNNHEPSLSSRTVIISLEGTQLENDLLISMASLTFYSSEIETSSSQNNEDNADR